MAKRDFRDGERRLVARLVEGERRVIATGGGAFVDPATRELLKRRRSPSGSTPRSRCWPSAPAAATPAPAARTATAPRRWPGSISERRPYYAEADIHVRSGNGAHGDVVDAIIAALDDWYAR